MKNKIKHIFKFILLATLFLLCLNRNSYAQTIVAAEYFFNTDPGVGNGTPFTITPGNDITKNLIIPTTGLNPGFNHLFIRFKNNLGIWSLYANQTILINSVLPPTTQIIKGEYFFDTDPGVGNATPITITPGDDITVSFPVSTLALTDGFHALFFRTKDMDGKWSLYNDRIIFVVKPIPNSNLVYGEYFFNTDTAFGSGVPFSFPAVANKDTNLIISTAGLPAGVNILAFRFRDSLGVYSLNAGKDFRICDVAALANFTADTVCLGQDSTTFNNLSTGGDTLTRYKWDFDGNGTIDYQTTGVIGQGSPAQFRYKYIAGGTFQCKLITDNGGGCSDTIIKPVVVISYPAPPVPMGTSSLCINSANSTYTIPVMPGATTYTWYISPTNAGVLTSNANSVTIDWNNTFTGVIQLTVKADYGTCTSNQSAPLSPSLTITISPPTVAGTISLAQSAICEGSATGNITLSGFTGTILTWYKRLNGGTWSNCYYNGPIYSETPSSAGTWDYRAVVKNSACDTAFSNYATITVYPKPSAAGTIVGSPMVCEGQYQVSYSVPAISGATSYTWTLPFGATISSGQGTNSILVNFYMGANSGGMTVFGSNTCGIGSTSQPYGITVNPSPIANAGSDLVVWWGTTDTLTGSAFGGTPGINPAYTYSWSPTSLLTNPNIQNPITNPMWNSTPFTLTATDSLGCSGTDQVNVIVVGQPLNATVTADPPIICQGTSSHLNVVPGGGSGTYTYAWTSNPVGFNSTIQNPVVTPTATTQYIVVVTNGSQTVSASTTITISPKPGPSGTITGSGTVCNGQTGVAFSVPLIANATGYSWTLPSGATLFSGSNTNSIVVDFSNSATAGVISVFGTNMCGSGLPSQGFNITVNPLPLADAGQTQNIANGTQTTLHGLGSNGSGNYSYAWSPAIQLINANVQNPLTDTLTNSTSFTLTVTDNQTSCYSSASVLVLVTGFPLSVTTTAVPATICQGGSSEINALPSGGSGTYTYSWSSDPNGFTSNIQNPTVSPSVTTEYVVTVTASGQSATSNVIVTVSPIPTQPGPITGNSVVCRGETNVLYSVPVVPGANTYYWSLPPGASIYSGNGTNTIIVNYSLNAFSGDISVYASNFCGSSPLSVSFPVLVNILPNVNSGGDIIISSGATATLNGSASGGSGHYSFAWTPTIIIDGNPNIANPTTIPLGYSNTLILTVIDSVTGCSNTSSMQIITTGGSLTAIANATPQTICEGTSTQINALPQGGTGNYTYSWTSNPAGFTSTVKNPTVSPNVITTYTVDVEDGSQQAFASITVSINPLPIDTVDITGDAQICQGTSGVLYSIPIMPYATGYNWTLPSGIVLVSGSNTNTITVNYTQAAVSGIISVAGTNFCGVGDTSQFPVHVDSTPIVNAGTDIIIAQNGTTPLNGIASGGTGNFSYSWTPAGNVSNPLVPNPTTSQMASSGIFTLEVTDNVTGCQNSDQVQVIVTGPQLSVEANATPLIVCEGGQSNLFALPTGGTGMYTYLWSSVPIGFNSSAPNPTVAPTVTTLYNVTISDGAQTASSAISVTISSLPGAAGQISGPTSVCKGENGATFSIPIIPGATSYAWSLPNGATIASGANTNTINVNFTLLATSGLISVYGLNTCGNGVASSYQLTVNPLPTANAGPDLYINSGTSTTLQGTATGGYGTYDFLWSPSILLSTPNNIQNPITVGLTNPTTYYLTVTDATSFCKGTDNVTIYILGGPLSVGATASPTNICQGQSSSLNAIPTGGSGNYTYSWTSNPGTFTSTLPNPIVTPTVTTTYHVTLSSDTITATANVVVTVNPLPATPGPITGTSVICQGVSNIVYSVTPISGATSYNWILPIGASIIGGQGTNSITVNFSSTAVSGTIKVNGVNLCGSGPQSPAFQLTVNPSPLVNAGTDLNITSGSSTTLMGSVTGGIGPFSYSWSPIMFFSPQSQAQQLNATTVNLSSSVTFTLTVLDSASGCSAFDQMNVYIGGGALTLSTTASPTNICQGQISQLNALPSGGIGTYQYLWSSFPPSSFTSTLPNPTVSPTVTTQYLVVVNDNTDTVSQSIVVNVNPQPDTAGVITGTSPVCQGSTSVMYTVPPIANTTSYVWNVPQGFTIVSGNGTNTIYVDVDNDATSGTISVFGINSCGAGIASPYFDVNVDLTPFAYTTATQLVPLGSATQLFGHAVGGSGSYTYTWQPASLLVNSNDQNPWTINLTQSATFTLIVTDNVSGCPTSAQIQIIVFGGPLSVVASSNISSICSGSSVLLNALPSGGNGQYIYNWTPNIGLDNSTIYNPVATPNITTEYVVNVTSGGLTATSSVLITVYPQPGTAGAISGDSSFCQGETGVMFTVPPIANATSYYWTVPYGATIVSGSNTNSIMVNFSQNATSGNITVYGGNICGFSNASPNFWVTVNPIPTVYAGADQQITQGNAYLNGVVTGGSGAYTYSWTPASLLQLNISDIINPITLSLNASQIFTLYATDTVTGCTNSDYMKVIICGGTLSVLAIADNNNICAGQSVYLDALPSGGNCVTGTYTWTSIPTYFSSPLVNPVATPSVSTTYIVSYNDGTNTATYSVQINVNPLVGNAGPIQGMSSVCQNSGTLTYSIAPIVGADSYVWTFPQGTIFTSNPDSNVVEVIFTNTALSGFISVYGTSLCGFGLSSPIFPVIVKPIPSAAGQIVGPSYMSKNNTAQFTVPPIPGVYTYNWVLPFGAIIISGQGTNSITVEFTDTCKSGFIYVYGYNSCGSGDPSSEHLLTILTSMAELYGIELKLYPNPSNGEFILDLNGDILNKYELKVLNLFGSEVYSSVIFEKLNRLDLSNLSNGMYYLILTNDKVKIVEKFVIVK